MHNAQCTMHNVKCTCIIFAYEFNSIELTFKGSCVLRCTVQEVCTYTKLDYGQ